MLSFGGASGLKAGFAHGLGASFASGSASGLASGLVSSLASFFSALLNCVAPYPTLFGFFLLTSLNNLLNSELFFLFLSILQILSAYTRILSASFFT